MTKLDAIATAKQFRKDADELLQRMKDHRLSMMKANQEGFGNDCVDLPEAIAQHVLSLRDLESCIMRQGMALKYIGNPNPYPESYNPASPVVESTADGLKL